MFNVKRTLLKTAFSLVASAQTLMGCGAESGNNTAPTASEAPPFIEDAQELAELLTASSISADFPNKDNETDADSGLEFDPDFEIEEKDIEDEDIDIDLDVDEEEEDNTFVEMTYEEAKNLFSSNNPDTPTVLSDFKAERIVCWGDSGAKGFCNQLKGIYTDVLDMGTNSAGLLATTKPKDYRKIPKGSAVIVCLLGNDIGWLMKASNKKIAQHARNLVNIVTQIEKSGSKPILMLRGPSNGKSRQWDDTRQKVNNALVSTAEKAGVNYLSLDPSMQEKDGGLKREFSSRDGVHLSGKAYKMRGQAALDALGIDLSDLRKGNRGRHKAPRP